MKYLNVFLIIGLISVISGCSPVIVKTDYDREYDFSQYKTYRWPTQAEAIKTDELAKNNLAYKRVVEAVDKIMQAKGLTKKEVSETDLVIFAHAGVKNKMQINQYGGYGGWYQPWWGPYGGHTDVSYYEEGTLIIDLVDSKKKELAWRGSGTGVVKDYDTPEEMQKNLDEILAKILANYPPDTKK